MNAIAAYLVFAIRLCGCNHTNSIAVCYQYKDAGSVFSSQRSLRTAISSANSRSACVSFFPRVSRTSNTNDVPLMRRTCPFFFVYPYYQYPSSLSMRDRVDRRSPISSSSLLRASAKRRMSSSIIGLSAHTATVIASP